MIQELRVENHILKNRQDQATRPDIVKKPSTQVKVPKPDLYYRERTKTQSFLIQLEDYLHFAKGQFGNDADKYLKKPRGLAILTRNEEVLDLDDIIESFLHDDEIVNSKDGEFYDSTEAEEDSSDEKDLVEVEESPLAGAINRLLKKVEEYGIITKIPLHHGESEQGI
ncbi:hypothetical protein GTA08_BOTSDO08556 [Neofusicoccum parvum]|nr:hypothetical protein GTA08_BOTSDO08556 [Neofusicoccum parvum]